MGHITKKLQRALIVGVAGSIAAGLCASAGLMWLRTRKQSEPLEIKGTVALPQSDRHRSSDRLLVEKPALIEQTVGGGDKAAGNARTTPMWISSHDFGLVRGKVRLKHVFRVNNTSPVPWTLHKIETGYSCMAANATEKPVQPGQVFEVTTYYTTPDRDTKGEQNISVTFEEAGAPMLVLKVRAKNVRKCSLSKNELVFGPVARGTPATQSLEVLNNSEQDWQGLDVTANVPWVSTEIRNERPDAASPWCKQRWILAIRISSDRLSFGPNLGMISVQPPGASLEAQAVKLTTMVSPRLQYAPSQLFLGDLHGRHQPAFSLMLRFSPDQCPVDPSLIEVTHDLGKALAYDKSRVESTPAWKITGRLVAKELKVMDGYARGVIHLRFPGGHAESVDVPLYARVP